MKYGYICDICDYSFEREYSMTSDEKNKPLTEKCPRCKKKGGVRRDYSGISLTYDTLGVTTRAKRVGGEAFTEVMKNIKKKAGKGNTVQI